MPAKLLPILPYNVPFIPPPLPRMARMAPRGLPEAILPEPVEIRGRRTGKVYLTAGEPGNPETIQVTPVNRPYAPRREKGQQTALTGAQLLALGYDPNEIAKNPALAAGLNAAQDAAQASAVVNPMTSSSTQAAPTDPLAAVNQAQSNVTAAKAAHQQALGAGLDAEGKVLAAQGGLIPAMQGQIDAQGNLLGAQGKLINANTGVAAKARQDAAKSKAELIGLNAAANNVEDKAAVARAQHYQDSQARLYAAAGVAAPRGVVGLTESAPGIRPEYQTQEQLLGQKYEQAKALRGADLAIARAAVNLMQSDVQSAELMARRAGLTLDQAQLAVSQAQQDAGVTSLATARARLDETKAAMALDQAQQGPAGMKLDINPFTLASEWVTPAEAARRQTGYQQEADKIAYQSDDFAGMSPTYILGSLLGAGLITPEQATEALIAKGFSPDMVAEAVKKATERGGSGTEIVTPEFGAETAGQSSAADFANLPNFFGDYQKRVNKAFTPIIR